jgi:hypothetical protein
LPIGLLLKDHVSTDIVPNQFPKVCLKSYLPFSLSL